MITNDQLFAFVRKNMISVVGGALSVAIIGVLYLRSDVGPAADEQLAQRSAEGERLEANIENSAQLKEQYDALVAANAAIEKRMIHVSQLADNLQYFYKMESDTATKLVDLKQIGISSQPKGAAKGSYVPIGFSVTVQGDYPSLLDFLRRVESGSHYTRVNSLVINPGSADRTGLLVMSLSLEILGSQ